MNDLPGRRINQNAEKLIAVSIAQLNPNEIDPIENMKRWRKIDNAVYDTNYFSIYNAFYLIYNHPVHDYLDRIYWVENDILENFMKERIYPDREEGLDIIVVPPRSRIIIVCNHDGDIYQVDTDLLLPKFVAKKQEIYFPIDSIGLRASARAKSLTIGPPK